MKSIFDIAFISATMGLRGVLPLLLLGLASAGPVSQNRAQCSQECSGDSKFQYSEKNTYVYSYEASNTLHMERSSELSSVLKATIEITPVSKCDMVLQITDANVNHGDQLESSSVFIDNLKKNALNFAWVDGKISNICPSEADSEDTVNVKRGILSTLQNTMKTLSHDSLIRETDVLGSCDTEYKVKEHNGDKFVIYKTKKIPSCSNHIKYRSRLITTPYESPASAFQHLPLMSDGEYSCHNIINGGIIQEAFCSQKSAFSPLRQLAYAAEANSETKLQFLTKKEAHAKPGGPNPRKGLVYTYEHRSQHLHKADAVTAVRHLCEQSQGLLNEEVGKTVHELVYLVRGLDSASVKKLYESVKNKEICSSDVVVGIFLDVLKTAASEGSFEILTEQVTSHQLSKEETFLWIASMPFVSDPEEGAIRATIPLLKHEGEEYNYRALLGVSAMAYKYCTNHPDCESSPAIQSVISSLESYLKNDCETSSDKEEEQVITALKAFGNLGFVGSGKEAILKCAAHAKSIPVRVASLEGFRRSPCSDSISSELLRIYENVNEDDEVRISALITLSKCPSPAIIFRISKTYAVEKNRQVAVFTWTYLDNLKETSDPLKLKAKLAASKLSLTPPDSTDITKFSRNFELSSFSELANLGYGLEANVIHSHDSFLPRSGNVDFKVDVFGQQIKILEVGLRVENLEHKLEEFLGPKGVFPASLLNDLHHHHKGTADSTADTYKARIKAIREKVAMENSHNVKGAMYIRVMGNELEWHSINDENLKDLKDINPNKILDRLGQHGITSNGHSLMFLDGVILFPSLTGRAYKLAANGSATVGLQTEGKLDIKDSSLRNFQFTLDKRYKPSATVELDATMSIHSEDYEPGLKVATTLNVADDVKVKLELKEGPSLNAKINLPTDTMHLISLKRAFYEFDHAGERVLPGSESQDLKYCTKYLGRPFGLQYCGHLTIPKLHGNLKEIHAPLTEPIEFHLKRAKTDNSINDYEFQFHLPDSKDDQLRQYKVGFDTPGSSTDRKFLAELILHYPDKDTSTSKFKFSSPYYNLEADASYVSRPDKLELGIEILGDQVRKYVASLSVDINIRGARLAEYKPTLTLGFPGINTIRFFGTIVAARGRKQQLSFDIKSENFANYPFLLKGNIAREGTFLNPESEFQVLSEVTIEAFSKTYKLYGTYKRVALNVNMDIGLDYFPVDKSVQSIKLKTAISDVNIDPFSFKLEDELLMSEYPEYNVKIDWDFSAKFLQRLRNNIVIHYGRDFKDPNHMIQITHVNALEGDFFGFTHMNFENEIALIIPALHIDSSASSTLSYDFVKKPKFLLDVGIKIKPESQIKLEISFESLNSYGKRPIRLNTELKFIYLDYEFIIRDNIEETSPNLLHGRLIIKPRPDKQITIDHSYAIRSTDKIFYHELECTIIVPERAVPVQLKLYLKHSRGSLEFGSHLDIGNQSPFVIDVKINPSGTSELILNLPFLEGKMALTEAGPTATIAADFKIITKEQRRIKATGQIMHGNPDQLQLEVSWDADKDANQKLVLKGKSTVEGTGRTITASVNYADSITIEVSGKLGDPLRYGPHQIRADFSGHMEPMSVVFSYEVSEGELKSAIKYLRNDVEKLRTDITGKFIHRSNHLEIQGGAIIVSPYKAFDGKQVYAGILIDSNEATRSFVTEYRLKRSPNHGYVAKIDYRRKRGFPGNIKARAEFTVHKVPLYEANMNAEYGGGKYYFKGSVMPTSNKKFHLDTTMEISARYAAFHHSLVTTFQHLQLIRINALADLRDKEEYKVQTNFDVNDHKLYDFNATLSSRSITDFEGKLLLFGKIAPSVHIFSKAQNANSLTKYSLIMEKNSHEVFSGKGEIRKRKKGFNGNIVFNYKGGDILTVDLNSEVKSQRERNYVIKFDSRSRSYTISIHSQKEKKGNKVSVTACRNQNDKCISLALNRKNEDGRHDWQLTYRRDDVELNLDHAFFHMGNNVRSSFVLHSGERRFGYSIEFDSQGHNQDDKQLVSFGIILPSREIKFATTFTLSPQHPEIEFLLQADARNHPERKLTVDFKIDNQLLTDRPSSVQIKINHPVLEKSIDIHAMANYDNSKAKFLIMEVSLDFSQDPEDKIISKMYWEKLEGMSYVSVIDIYHKDDQHLDFVIKTHSSMNDGNLEFGQEMNWKDENNEDKKAYFDVKCNSKEEKFNFVYHRPKLDFKIDAIAVSPQNLHEDVYEVDFDITYNQAHTKARLIHNYHTHCRKLDILNDHGAVIQTVEMCTDLRSPVIFSLKIQSLVENTWVFDYSLEVVLKKLSSINIRHHWNPEFLGGLVFQITQFASELTDAGVGQLPISEAPIYKKLSKSFHSKVVDPLEQHVLEEAEKFFHEILVELKFFKEKAYHYYQKLPPLSSVLQYIQSLKPLFDAICKEIHSIIETLTEDLKLIFNDLLRRSKETVEKLRLKCVEYPECEHLLEAVSSRDWKHLEQVAEALISRLPAEIKEYVRRGGKIEQYLNHVYKMLHTYLEEHSDLVKRVVGIMREVHGCLHQLYRKYYASFMRVYKNMLRNIQKSEALKEAIEFMRGEGRQILKDLQELDFDSLMKLAKRLFESYLPKLYIPSLRTFFKINELDSDRGVFDLDIFFPFHYLAPSTISNYFHFVFSKIAKAVQLPLHYNWKTLLALLKKTAELDIIPPYKEQALILGQQHYVTFDKTFYDFAGECTYLVASDLIDGNFSIIITPTFSLADGDSGSREPSLGVIVKDTAVLINLKDKRVKYGAQLINLPLETEDLTVTREGNVISVDDHHGVHVECHVIYDICTATISGWYYGKTAGLFGTYDYEPGNDFRRPRGQIPNSVTTFAKSWDLNKGCKTKNLVAETKIDTHDENYKLCAEIFAHPSSPLSACFSEIKPEEYKDLCYRYLLEESDKQKAICNIAAAYVLECEKNYVELDLPPSCLTCQIPNGAPMKHGERKTFKNLNVKSSDTIFVVEASACNDHLLKDLDNIARSIDRELVNEGFQDNMYGLVIFDESGHDPYVKTVRGRILFNINDIAEIPSSIHLTANTNTTTALEALGVAVTYPFRIGTSKTLILMTCSPCKYDFKSLQYPVIQQILLEHDIILHVISDQELRVKKAGSTEREIIGADADTVYHLKDVTQKELTGEPALRSQISIPKDACAALAQDVDGSFFSTRSFGGGDVSKSWRSILARRVLKTAAHLSPCYICDCTSTADHVAKVDCQPCHVRKPRLPFSVCKTCNYPTPLLSLYSYILHMIL